MKSSNHISPFRKTLFFILGLLVAGFVVSQEVISFYCADLVQEEQEQADAGEEDQEGTTFEYSCDVMLPAATDLLKPFIPLFLHDVVRDSEQADFPKMEVPLYDTPHYKTLFRQIISPNAP